METSPYPRPTRGIPHHVTRFVGFYGFVLMALYNLAAIGLISVPVNFLLMDKFKLPPTQVSVFGFCTDSPYFIGFAFGFLRDRWRPMGKGDRGYFFFVPLLMAALYVFMAFDAHTYAALVIGMALISACAALLGAAAQGLMSAIAKDFGMMGRLSVIAIVTARGSMMYSAALGGWLGDHTPWIAPFLVSAAVCLTVILMAFWRPKTIFRSGDEVFVNVIPEGALAAARRLGRHTAVYLPALILFLWEFAPGWGTPLMFYLTKQVGLSETTYGAAQGWLRFSTVVAALSYSWLCKHLRFKPLLYWGTFLGVIGGPVFLLIHSAMQAYVISSVAGICCGIALAAYYDLLVRSCPKELEGVAFMLSYAMFTLASDASDIFGSWLYEKGGFGLALGISTACTALIFIPVFFVPHAISDPHEGERITDPDPPVLEDSLFPREAAPVQI